MHRPGHPTTYPRAPGVHRPPSRLSAHRLGKLHQPADGLFRLKTAVVRKRREEMSPYSLHVHTNTSSIKVLPRKQRHDRHTF